MRSKVRGNWPESKNDLRSCSVLFALPVPRGSLIKLKVYSLHQLQRGIEV